MIYTTTLILDPIDLPNCLANQSLFPKFYIKSREEGEERAAFGSLLTLLQVPKYIPPSFCFYGSISFPQRTPKDPLWRNFSKKSFFLPQYEIRQFKTGLTTLIHRSYFNMTEKEILASLKGFPSLNEPSPLNARKDTPTQKQWTEDLIPFLCKKIKENAIQKIVLARKTSFTIPLKTSSFSWLQKIIRTCPSTETFALQPSSSSLFLGSSPERLYWRQGTLFSTEAIAGTVLRGNTSSDDSKQAQELLTNKKYLTELEYIKLFLQEKTSSFCDIILPSTPHSIIQTDSVQHLAHSLRGLLHQNVQDKTILTTLHPTPAVNGYPSKQALSVLHSLEPFDRGLYAGLVGWLSEESASFTVAIRSALIQNGVLHAFAGAGIVEGSDPTLEWEELEHKIQHWRT